MMKSTNAYPKSAPARVDCTRWDTPMQVLANNIPGPSAFSFFLKSGFILI